MVLLQNEVILRSIIKIHMTMMSLVMLPVVPISSIYVSTIIFEHICSKTIICNNNEISIDIRQYLIEGNLDTLCDLPTILYSKNKKNIRKHYYSYLKQCVKSDQSI